MAEEMKQDEMKQDEMKQDETKPADGAENDASGSGEIPVKESDAGSKRGALATLADIEHEVESAIDRIFRSSRLPSLRDVSPFTGLRGSLESRMPKVDVIDRDDAFVVEAELPGVKKDDVDVSVSADSITIKATSSREEEKEKGDYHRREISRGFFSRTLRLPGTVAAGQAAASFENGLLKVTLPKSEGTQRHTIEVS